MRLCGVVSRRRMAEYRGRRAVTIANGTLRVTVLQEGGHIAEITDLASGVNPLWTPHWPSIEPSRYDAARDTVYGGGADGSLLAGIMGHNLCLDIFGGPSDAEGAAGFPVHGETSTARFDITHDETSLAMEAVLPAAQLRIARRIALDGDCVRVQETVTNLSAADRPVGWTQHVTIGPPFLAKGATELRITADRSLVYPGTFGPADYLRAGAEFTWPHAPRATGGTADLGVYSNAPSSSAYTAHRMTVASSRASWVAYSPQLRLAFGYEWQRQDFPWLGIWEENHARRNAPWNGAALTCGLEFGVSPIPESRREMIERGRLFDTPTFRWIPARGSVEVYYLASLRYVRTPSETTGGGSSAVT
jgi:hypothetical protein